MHASCTQIRAKIRGIFWSLWTHAELLNGFRNLLSQHAHANFTFQLSRTCGSCCVLHRPRVSLRFSLRYLILDTKNVILY